MNTAREGVATRCLAAQIFESIWFRRDTGLLNLPLSLSSVSSYPRFGRQEVQP